VTIVSKKMDFGAPIINSEEHLRLKTVSSYHTTIFVVELSGFLFIPSPTSNFYVPFLNNKLFLAGGVERKNWEY
jgi:hypothetical protein